MAETIYIDVGPFLSVTRGMSTKDVGKLALALADWAGSRGRLPSGYDLRGIECFFDEDERGRFILSGLLQDCVRTEES